MLIATVCNAQVPKDTGDVDPAAVSQDARDASYHEWIKSGKKGVDIVRRADGSLERIFWPTVSKLFLAPSSLRANINR